MPVTGRDSNRLGNNFSLISSKPWWDASLSSEPTFLLESECGKPGLVAFQWGKWIVIARGCLHRGACAETHFWDTSPVNNCWIWSATLPKGWAFKFILNEKLPCSHRLSSRYVLEKLEALVWLFDTSNAVKKIPPKKPKTKTLQLNRKVLFFF